MMEDQQVFEILLAIESIVQGEGYRVWLQKFINDHVDKFDFGEENKLEYTEIFQKFEDGIETQIIGSLPDGAARLPAFMEALPAYLESDAGKKEETSRAVTMLMQMSEFTEFKEMMMYAKKEREDEAASAGDLLGDAKASDGAVLSVDGLLDMCAALSSSGESDEGWVTCFTNDWLKIDKREVDAAVRKHKNEIYLRGVMTMNLSYIEVCDMMLYFGERRRLWDKNYAGHEMPLGHDVYDDDDAVIKSKLDFGTLLHMVGVPRSLLVKYVRRWNIPKAGMVTTAMVPWDLTGNCVDHNNSILTVKCNTLMPHPALPDKSIITTLETNKMGGMPKWALKMMISSTAPSLMSGLEKRYIQNVRKANKTIDMTPEGRKKRVKDACEW
jgi:ADP-ribosylation factor 2-binding protein